LAKFPVSFLPGKREEKKMKKFVALLLAAVMVLSLAACGGNGGNGGGSSADKTSINVCIASEPQSLDPALNSAVDGATMLVHLFSGLAKWTKNGDAYEIVADMAEELVDPVDNGDGTFTYTYKIRDAKWSDGEPVKAADFEYGWKRATSAEISADYYYMFEYVDGFEELPALADNKLNDKAVDDKTLEVTTTGQYPFWNELLAFPTYFPVREDKVDDEGTWATDPSTYVSNGMYTLASWEHNSLITLEKNPNHPDADEVTMDVINFYLSDDANNMLSNFKNGDWLLIDDVPTNEIATLKEEYPTEFKVDGQIGTYYVCWNINEDISPAGKELSEQDKAKIRNAIALLFDRNYIVEEIGQAGQVPASSFVAMGITEPDGDQFYQQAGGGPGFDYGYYAVDKDSMQSNLDLAMDILDDYYTVQDGKLTDFPVMTYLYNTSEGHKAIGEYLQSCLANIGITMNLENQEWATFLETRKNGDYSIARNGWLADYNDAISFLDMWTSGSGNNDVQFGKGDHAKEAIYDLDLSGVKGYEDKGGSGTWADTYDKVIGYIKTEQDLDVRNDLMHCAEDLLMTTGCICPLYYYTDLYMLSDKVNGFFAMPLGYKYFMYTTVSE